MKWKSLSRVRLFDPIDCSPPGSSVHGILQARILEWGACPPPGDRPNTGIKLRSLSLQADSLLSEQPRKLVKTHYTVSFQIFMQAANYFERMYLSWITIEWREPGLPCTREMAKGTIRRFKAGVWDCKQHRAGDANGWSKCLAAKVQSKSPFLGV